jgi:hypothetical protein
MQIRKRVRSVSELRRLDVNEQRQQAEVFG